MKMADVPEQNRPRERLLSLGAAALSDAELLALIFKTGNAGENAVDMSNRLLAQHGMEELPQLGLAELQKVRGIGPAKAMQVVALFELARRQAGNAVRRRPLNSPKDVFDYLSPKMSHLLQEHFVVLHLDSKNRVKKEETVSVGTLNTSIVHPREVFRSAIREGANAVIVAHNHPSGDTAPSEEDKEVTRQLAKAAKILGVPLLGHIIIGGNGAREMHFMSPAPERRKRNETPLEAP